MIRELKKQIKSIVDPISELSFEVYPDNAIFPHCVGELTVAYYKEGLFTINLDIDVWDRNTSTKNVDEISEQIMNALDRLHFHDDVIEFTSWFTTLLNSGSDDKTLRRKTCVFEIQARRVKL